MLSSFCAPQLVHNQHENPVPDLFAVTSTVFWDREWDGVVKTQFAVAIICFMAWIMGSRAYFRRNLRLLQFTLGIRPLAGPEFKGEILALLKWLGAALNWAQGHLGLWLLSSGTEQVRMATSDVNWFGTEGEGLQAAASLKILKIWVQLPALPQTSHLPCVCF